jgi:hypothetical protein
VPEQVRTIVEVVVRTREELARVRVGACDSEVQT